MGQQHIINYGKLKVYLDDTGRDNQDSFGGAVVALIEATDTEAIGDEPHPFYDKALAALARHYAAQWPDPENYTLKQVLETMLRECAERPGTRLNMPFAFED